VLVQRSVFDGVMQTPKGTIGKLALTRALREALAELTGARRHHGPLVLYRRP
jgi:hypothetical protein